MHKLFSILRTAKIFKKFNNENMKLDLPSSSLKINLELSDLQSKIWLKNYN